MEIFWKDAEHGAAIKDEKVQTKEKISGCGERGNVVVVTEED